MGGIVQQEGAPKNKGFGRVEGIVDPRNFRSSPPEGIDMADIVDRQRRHILVYMADQQFDPPAKFVEGRFQLATLILEIIVMFCEGGLPEGRLPVVAHACGLKPVTLC